MDFKEQFNELYHSIGCTQAELSAASGLSPSVISRYLSGEREPALNSPQIDALAHGLSALAFEKEISVSSKEGVLHTKKLQKPAQLKQEILDILNAAIRQKEQLYASFQSRFNELLSLYKVNMKELADKTNFDVSYLYRVRSGERRPVDLERFCILISEYIAGKYNSDENLAQLSGLLHCSMDKLSQNGQLVLLLKQYLIHSGNCGKKDTKNCMSDFLQKMNDFNLEEYIRVIHFDELKIPTSPIRIPTSRYYYGIEEMRAAELDFFKATAIGKSKEPIFMFGDMPMVDMADDMDFNKKWMFGIAACIKKGFHIHIIHHLNRPFEELMLGFEAWIPIYMTGQLSPYHLPDYKNDVFHQLNYCSGSAALFGECIDGFHEDGRYYLSNNRADLNYYRKKTDDILSHAEPLMQIYNQHNKNSFFSFTEKSRQKNINRHVISSSLPLYTMPEPLLMRLISSLDEADRVMIIEHYQKLKNQTEKLLAECDILYDTMELTSEEFAKSPSILAFSELFLPQEISYSYGDYLMHLEATRQYEQEHMRFTLRYNDIIPFRNIEITILEKQYFVVSKCKSPNIHFVIYHPIMLNAMEHFQLAKKEP